MQRGRSKYTTGDHCCSSLWFLMSMYLDSAAPYLKVMSCSSHSPPASHTGQSNGWLPSSSSIIDLRACLILSLSVVTIMPSPTTVVQEVCNLGIFSISTRHMRQAPCSERPG